MDGNSEEIRRRKLLAARMKELSERSRRTGCYCYTDFLQETDSSVLTEAGISRGLSDPAVRAFGGFDDAERVIFRFGDPEEIGYEETFPIMTILVRPLSAKFQSLEHRDVLGAVMGLGIERDRIGDIRIRPEGAYVFATEAIGEHLLNNLSQVGKMTVTCTEVKEVPEDLSRAFEILNCVVSSLRVDCFVSELTGKSRSGSEQLIREKKVLQNGLTVSKNDAPVRPGDVLVIRGTGKFIYLEQTKTTGSGRMRVSVKAYR